MNPELFNVSAKALITNERDDSVLLLNLRPGDPNWEMPGGRLDAYESEQDALRRHLGEELPGIEVDEIGELLTARRVPGKVFGDTALCLLYYEAKVQLPERIMIPNHYAFKWAPMTAIDRPSPLGHMSATPGAIAATHEYLRRRDYRNEEV